MNPWDLPYWHPGYRPRPEEPEQPLPQKRLSPADERFWNVILDGGFYDPIEQEPISWRTDT